MDSYFVNKSVWITGASSGIGRALSIAFAQKGANCILSARSVDGLQDTLSMMENKDLHKIVPVDLTDEKQVESAFEKAGRVDVLINNAGVSQRSITLNTEMDVYRRLMEINYFSVVKLTKLVLPNMIKNGGGNIVTISSIAGKVGPPYRSGYAASKHALHGFFDALRAETSHKGMNILVVCPGFVNTPIAHNAFAGNGNKYNKPDTENVKGLSAEDLARDILKAIEKKKTEAYFGKFEVNAIRMKRFFPSILTKMLHKKYINDPEK